MRDDLLEPISEASPAGTDLRYDAVYLKIREARHADDDAPQGEWQRARKTADWAQVIALASDALATRSKDLQLAVWLAEALLHREGFGGLRDGLDLLRALMDRFWEHLYPPLEEGDAELRAAPLTWLGLRLDTAVKSVPLNDRGHSFFKYRESRDVGYEAACAEDADKLARRQAMLTADGKLSPEDFDRGVDATTKAWYKALVRDLDACAASLASLDALGRITFGDAAPGYAPLGDALGEVRRVGAQLLARKLEMDPDPADAAPSGDGVVAPGDASTAPQHAGETRSSLPPAGAEPSSRDDAVDHVIAAARYLRRAEPHDPASYLLLRGLRWGELRVHGSNPDPRLLDAPPTHVRTQLKRLLLDRSWTELLEHAEMVMSTPYGRGWLDLQRYTLTACDQLGSDFRFVDQAVRGALRLLLTDVPSLLDMTLMDDTPTANAETRAWLDASVLDARAGRAQARGQAHDADAASHEGWDAHDLAQAEVRNGRPERAIELLMRELATEKSQRGRFLRQAQVASLMVSAGLEAVAKPILEEMLARIEGHKLEEWETGTLVAEPLSLLYRCLDALDGDAAVKQGLYLRICRLDPVQAIAFTGRK